MCYIFAYLCGTLNIILVFFKGFDNTVFPLGIRRCFLDCVYPHTSTWPRNQILVLKHVVLLGMLDGDKFH